MKTDLSKILISQDRTRKYPGGFSVIEVLFCVFILGILVSLFSVSFLNFSPKYRLKKAVWEIISHLNYARYKAIFEGDPFRVAFASDSLSVQRFDKELNAWKNERTNFMEGATLHANNSPTFHPQGTVSNLASIIVSNSWGEYKITLAISGRIKAMKL
jgi:Tfp pilus assembly protein FimT